MTPPGGARGLLVTGTDTGVGKTVVAAGLLRLAHRHGLTPIPFKPVETGCDPDPLDALALWRAARPPIRPEEVCPHPLRLPAAPAAAAAAENIRLDLDRLVAHGTALAARGNFIIVEAAGGLLVPYGDGATTVDLAARLDLPLLVVARTALGTVNHSALTLRVAGRAGLAIAGLILNRMAPTEEPHESTNLELIAGLTGVRASGPIPYLAPNVLADPDLVADAVALALGPAAVARLLGLARG
jgi:dethiobiotin synthase